MKKLILLALLSGCTYNYPNCPTDSPTPGITVTPTPIVSVTPSPSPTKPAVSEKFKIGVWFQPGKSLENWKARGVTHLFGPELEGYRPEAEYMNKAQALGFRVIGNDKITRDWPALDSMLVVDEFDAKKWSMDQLRAYVASMNARVPGKKIFCSFAGPLLGYEKEAPRYQEYMSLCDEISSNWYPMSRNAERYSEWHVANAVSYLVKLKKPHQEIWSIVETANMGLKDSPLGRDPTPAEFRASLWVSIEAGATAIAYFPDFFNPAHGGWAGFERLAPGIEDEMKKFRAEIDVKWPLIKAGKLKVRVDQPTNAVTFEDVK
jgi:hypothetical protein